MARRIDEGTGEDQTAQEIRLSKRAAEIRKRFQEFANRPTDSPNVDREISNYRYMADSPRDRYEQKFGTPKKSNRSSPLDSGSKKSSKVDETSVRGSTSERVVLPKDQPRNVKRSSPVDLHTLPVHYDVRNDRYNATSPSHRYMADTSLTRPRTNTPEDRRRSKSPVHKWMQTKPTQSGRSTPSPSRSPERYDELDTITSFDKHYAKVDRYADVMEGRSRSPHVYMAPEFSPLEPEKVWY